MSSQQNPYPDIMPNPYLNTILVERHYIPADIYTQIYCTQPYQHNTNNQLYTNAPSYLTQQSTVGSAHNTQSRTQSAQLPTMTSRAPSRYNDLLSFFNMQSRNTTPTNTEPLQSRVVTRTYETAADMDQSFVNLLMTAFYTGRMFFLIFFGGFRLGKVIHELK
jgi:hypothetical protein